MRALLGAALLGGTFVLAQRLGEVGMVGFLNASALVLVGFGPLAVALMAYSMADLRRCVSRAFVALFSNDTATSRRLAAGLLEVARAHRRGRPEDTIPMAESDAEPLVRLSALLLLRRYDERSLRELVAARVLDEAAEVRRAEDLLSTLARLAPAFGLIGTIIGFIELLRHLEDPSSLGPGMAVALSATLYGIGLSYCAYHPVARALATQAKRLVERGKLVEHAILLVHRGRGPSDLELLLGRDASTRGLEPAARAVTEA